MAPPPPPPPGPPPPPCPPIAPPPAPSSGSDAKSRSALLQSIRAGKPLKKTMTNDRSSPSVAGKANGVDSSSSAGGGSGDRRSSSSRSGLNFSGSATIARSNGLGGLFADGMPKLRPTGIQLGQQQSTSLTSLNDTSNKSLGNSINNSHDIKRPNGISSTVKLEISKKTVDPKNRGPPPQPPQSQKNALPSSQSENRLSIGSVGNHNRSHSTVSLPGSRVSGKGKPAVAPKPPAPAPPTLSVNTASHRRTPTRAHSMRAPASPPVIAPPPNGGLFLNPELSKSSILHASTDSLIRGGRTRPSERPPPPPRPTLQPPPPPPGAPPPIPPTFMPPMIVPPAPSGNAPQPPIRTTSARSGIAPPLPATPPPPPPPTRVSTISRQFNSSLLSVDFESRFTTMFHSVRDFPPPQTFLGIAKVYNSKTAKQQAPAPPTQLQLSHRMWSNDTSTC